MMKMTQSNNNKIQCSDRHQDSSLSVPGNPVKFPFAKSLPNICHLINNSQKEQGERFFDKKS